MTEEPPKVPDLPDDEIDHLLSRGGLGRAQKERLLQGALGSARIAAPSRRQPRPSWQAIAGFSLVAGVAAFALWRHPSAETQSGLRSKGDTSPAPVIGLACLGGSLDACRTGSRIAFWLEGETETPGGFITAYADPAAGGQRVWYLTNEPAATPSSPANPQQVVPKGALIGQEQPAGAYRVHVVLTRHPVGRADLSRLPAEEVVTRAAFDVTVLP